MRKVLVAVALTLALVGASSVSAAEGGVPLPTNVTVYYGVYCPNAPAGVYGCAFPWAREIYVAPRSPKKMQETLYHEYGHQFDWDYVDAAEEDLFLALWGQPLDTVWNSPGPYYDPAELFADQYMLCYLGKREWYPGTCNLIRQVYLTPAPPDPIPSPGQH